MRLCATLQFMRRETSMAGIRLSRVARNRWRTAAIWAMLPLAAFNSRTVIGCGCSGHFESKCQCNCCDSHDGSRGDCSRCGGPNSSTCPCCSKVEKSAPAQTGESSECGTALHGPHCKVIVVHEVIPATVVSVHNGNDLNFSVLDLDTIDLPIVVNQLGIGDTGLACLGPPPRDLVVTLRRLVI